MLRALNLIILFLSAITVYAQTIRGKVVEKNSLLPIEFANVILLQKSDSSFIAGTTTDSLGNFILNTKQINHLLKFSFLGHETKFLNVENENIGTITLTIDSANILSEVTVIASRPIIKMENGGISTDIQNSYLKNFGTAEDVLGQLPFVNREKDKITVLGKGLPLIYINNRLVRDMSELDQLNSNLIKKVTVITNPGSEYDSTVQSAIRIETIKQIGEGLSGNIMLRSIVDKCFSHNETVNLNYRHRNFDVFGMFRYGKMSDLLITKLSQTINSNDATIEVTQNGNDEVIRQNYRTNMGMNYVFNKNHSAGIKFQNTGNFVNNYLSNSDINTLENNALIETLRSALNAKNNPRSNYLNTYYEGTFADWLSAKLNIDYANGSNFSGHYTQNFRQDYTEIIKTENKNNYNLYAAKLIFTSPLWQGKLNYGYEFSKTVNNQHFDVIEQGESNILQSSQNTANQLLNSAFFTYSKQIDKFSTNLALRYENVNFQYFNNGIRDEKTSRIYNNLFPSTSVAYENGRLQMQLNYRNSTYRPSYYQLRNEVQYDSPYLYEGGNPYLKPTKINTLSYILVWKDLQTEIAYNIYKDRILFTPILLTENTIFFQPNNLDKSENISISVAYSPTIKKYWKPSLELSLLKDNVKYGEPLIYYGKPIFSTSFKNNILLFKDLRLGVNFAYQTKGNSDIDYLYNSFQADMFLSKHFFNNKLRVNFGINDIFGTFKQEVITIGNDVQAYRWKNLNTRNINISINYDFNSIKSKYKGEQASDELNRL